jgi:tRNA threonylcarbamoyladenosine biosynthesis protein TsaE
MKNLRKIKKSRYLSENSRQTRAEGRKLAGEIVSAGTVGQALAIGLEGELGGGKTTFLQGFAEGLGIKERVLSPTFVIMRKFRIPSFLGKTDSRKSPFRTFYHFDCYRLKDSEEIASLGIGKILSCPENIVAVEWADKIRKILPEKTVWIDFKFINSKTRKITIASDQIN